MAEHGAEQVARLAAATCKVQRLDQPEGAHVECRLGRAEIVFSRIAQHMIAATQVALHRLEGFQEAFVVGRKIAQFHHLQQARIEIVAFEAGAVMTALLAPRVLFDLGADRLGAVLPVTNPVALAEARGDIGEAVASRPAHYGRIGMDLLPRSEFPKARIGLVVLGPGGLAHFL